MKDFIERETLGIGKCNPDVFENKGYAEGWNSAVEIIMNAPAADVVEVVRCKDCKWYAPVKDWGFDEITGRRDHSKIIEKPYGECHGQDFSFTEDGCLRVGKDDFCSYGERKDT